ncbi:Binding partner of acd11 [Thalictrum thalictroides]|uniref:Binding partner of acd11 n=1 Tax=Thalictrum thalictroides TaxID=46969 RepID=A0A7J6X2N3_THATH|nr:Binding partner of acd11 [Thalictrum thalictroides]
MSPVGYTVEVTNLSPNASEKDVYDFFSFCGSVQHVEFVRFGEYACAAYVTFEDAYALETAVILSGATIVDQCVCIRHYGHYEDGFDMWNSPSWKNEDESGTMYAMHADPFVSSPSEAVTLAQEVVKTMVAKGYVLSKDAFIKAKAFDESYKLSALAAAKVAELSKRIGLTDKINAGVGAIKSVDEKLHVYEATKFVARTAATAVVNSSYFAKGALWVSDALTKAAKVAADLGSHHGNKS